jgi:hypothetical protein
MKKNLKLLLGFIIISLMNTSVYAGAIVPMKITHNMRLLSKAEFAKLKKTDTYYYVFAYDTHDEGGGYYSVKVYLVNYDYNTESYTYYTAPQNISIIVPSGTPGAGTYTFPEGDYSYEFGSFYFGDPPQTINITTNPTSLGGQSIVQMLEYYGGD